MKLKIESREKPRQIKLINYINILILCNFGMKYCLYINEYNIMYALNVQFPLSFNFLIFEMQLNSK